MRTEVFKVTTGHFIQLRKYVLWSGHGVQEVTFEKCMSVLVN